MTDRTPQIGRSVDAPTPRRPTIDRVIMRRPPNRGARWVANHPVLGAFAFGPLFGANLAANALWVAHLAGGVVAIGFGFFLLYGPFVVWVIRLNVGRWDAAHPN